MTQLDSPQRLRDWPLLGALFLVVLAMTAVDLALLERKYEIMRGGFLQAHPIQGTGPTARFVTALLSCELFMFAVVFFGVAALGARRGWPRGVTLAHVAATTLLASIFIVAGRYQVLGYFGDAFSLALIRNLGGGSILEAVLYVIHEGSLTLVALAVVLTTYFLVVRFARSAAHRRNETREQMPFQIHASTYLLLTLVSAAFLSTTILLVNQDVAMRYHLKKVSAYEFPRAALDLATDFDFDGYGMFSWSADPSPFNRSISPAALDIPSDGIDQDSLFGDFRYASPPSHTVTFGPRKDNLIVVVIESARADVLPARVSNRDVVPNLAAIARDGAAGRAYYSHTGFTTSSIKAMFSGSFTRHRPLSGSLFEILKANGYQVAVVSGQNESFGGMAQDLSMNTASDHFFDASTVPNERVFTSSAPGSLTLSNERVLAQLRTVSAVLDWSRPVFLYVNLQSPHFPYNYEGLPVLLPDIEPLSRDQISRVRRDSLWLTYLNAMANADRAVGEIASLIATRSNVRPFLLVITGDHGESLFDDGFLGHGHQINDVQTRPLLVTNRAATWATSLLGQKDLPFRMLEEIGATVSPGITTAWTESTEILQIVGSLSEPTMIGLVNQRGERVLYRGASREFWADVLGTWQPYDHLTTKSPEYMRFRRLIEAWETERWEDSRPAFSTR